MEIEFQWDEGIHRLKRLPESKPATQEENMRFASHVEAMQGTDPQAREVAHYEMAKWTYGQRDWYQPCKEVPGVPVPFWMFNAEREKYVEVRLGIRALSTTSNTRELEKLMENRSEVRRAVQFQAWCFRVSAVESYNFECCSVLLYAHRWLTELNPHGDALAIMELQRQLHEQYNIKCPVVGEGYKMQAAHAVTRLDWIPSAWRDVWSKP